MLAVHDETKVFMKHNLINEWKNKRILLVGLGVTGLSCAKFLYKHSLDFSIVDSRKEPTGIKELNSTMPDVSIVTGAFKTEYFLAADILVVSPGVSVKDPAIEAARKAGKLVTGDIDIFCQLITKPVIAITGSNGKSTVTQLIGDSINAANKTALVGGNIGVPALDLLEGPEPDYYVLELSSFQLETTAHMQNHIACLLNVSEDHLDRYSSYADYISAKEIILNNAGYVVALMDDKVVRNLLQKQNIPTNKIRMISYENESADYYLTSKAGEIFLHISDEYEINAQEFSLSGKHNYANILFVIAVLQLINIDIEKSLTCIKNFSGLQHRCQVVYQKNNIEWINDSKATNVGATLAALNGLSDKPIILLLGGQSKGQDFAPLIESIRSYVVLLLIFGQDAEKIARDINMPEITSVLTNLEQAVIKAKESAAADSRVLLSPACASFDQFMNYEHRGEVFAELVHKYGEAA